MIVVGGGIIGLSCAWRLAQRGLRVTLFDARELAAEASWTGAGMLAPGGEIAAASPLARMCLDSLAQYPEFTRELHDASGVAIDYRRCGGMELAFDETEALALDRRAEEQAAAGIRSERAAFAGACAARFFPDDAVVNPRDVNAALKLACARLGVRFREYEPVREVFPDGSGVRTALGTYRDDHVLIAAGAWSSGLNPLLPATTPVRGHLIAYGAKALALDTIVRHEDTYLLQRRTGLIVAGATTERAGFDRRLNQAALASIQARAERLLPALKALVPVARWNGFRPGIEGDFPCVGPVAGTGILGAFGHYRNGILLAPETARRIAAYFH